MSKRRKVLVILGVIALAAVCFVTLRPRDEPKYQGRYLSDWIAVCDAARNRLGSTAHDDSNPNQRDLAEAEAAVQAIGTNALPYFLKWMGYELPRWRMSLYQKLPAAIRDNRTVLEWIIAPLRRADYGYRGVRILGTNAIIAIPELEVMMSDNAKPSCARYARKALSVFGEPALPIFQAALADTNQADRYKIIAVIRDMIPEVGTNKCLPILVAALTHEDALVRETATNYVSEIAPEVLTNAPAD